MKKVLVIGGNAGGMSAASQVKRQRPGWEVTVLEKGRDISYGACGMPYYLEGIIPDPGELVALTPAEARQGRKIDLRLHHEATRVDPHKKQVEARAPGGTRVFSFDYLVIATGVAPVTTGLQLPGGETRRIFTLRSLGDMQEIEKLIKGGSPARCAVIGGGYIAVEMVEAFKARGLETHLVHRREDLANTFEKEISQAILKKMQEEGIVLKLNHSVSQLEEKEGRVTLKTDRGDLVYDLALVSTGVKPQTGFLKGSGLELGVKGTVKVNRYLQTNYDYIYAAGDCTETTNLITGKPVHVPLGPKANKEGYMAGINICGGREQFPGVLGSAITKVFDLGVSRTGLTYAEARENGFDPVKYQVVSPSRAGYYPGGGPLVSVITVDRPGGRILGAQLAGPLDSVKRVDVYAALIYNRMTLQEAFNLDLAYSPPFSPVYDPVIMAARVGKKHL